MLLLWIANRQRRHNAAYRGTHYCYFVCQESPVYKDKGKGKGHPITGQEGPEEEQMQSSTLPSTSSLDGGGAGGQRHAPAALPPGKTRYPLYRKLGGPQGRSERVKKISPHTGIRSPDRPVRSESLYRLRYTSPPQVVLHIKSICNLNKL